MCREEIKGRQLKIRNSSPGLVGNRGEAAGPHRGRGWLSSRFLAPLPGSGTTNGRTTPDSAKFPDKLFLKPHSMMIHQTQVLNGG